jgi:hypothetical protein
MYWLINPPVTKLNLDSNDLKSVEEKNNNFFLFKKKKKIVFKTKSIYSFIFY